MLYDLAVLSITKLPAIAHDSIIFDSVSNETMAGILKIYETMEKRGKQVFITFDKHQSKDPTVGRIVADHTVLSLGAGGNELYGRAWNIED